MVRLIKKLDKNASIIEHGNTNWDRVYRNKKNGGEDLKTQTIIAQLTP
jgi:hypothetical protein